MKTERSSGEISAKEYWKQHIRACNESGQNKSLYCRDHQLNYDQLMYWQKVLKKDKQASFIPVKVKHHQESLNEECICKLTMPSGHMLTIYDEKVLMIILDKWK